MVLSLHYGNAVAGDQRFDRPKLQEKLLRTLASSGGVKMFGLRRIGKSTLRRYVIERMEQAGKPVAFFDAQGLQSIQDLLGDLFGALPRESDLKTRVLGFIAKDSPVRNALEALASGTRTGEALVSAYWREAYNGIRKALGATSVPPLLVIDEFSLFLKNILERTPEGRDEIDQLLAAMREWRAAGMKMLLTGSIGVTALSRRYQLTGDHLNDLQPFDVPELSDDEAREFIRQATEKPSQGRWRDEHTGKFIVLDMLVEDGFIHFSEDADANRTWRPASRLARLWWKRSRLT